MDFHNTLLIFLLPFQGSWCTDLGLSCLWTCFTKVQNTKYYFISYFIILLFGTQYVDFVCKVIPYYDDNL